MKLVPLVNSSLDIIINPSMENCLLESIDLNLNSIWLSGIPSELPSPLLLSPIFVILTVIWLFSYSQSSGSSESQFGIVTTKYTVAELLARYQFLT